VVWLDLGPKECSVSSSSTGGMGTCDGIVMALGIVALVGARGSHYPLPSEGIRHCSVTILLREMDIQPLGKSERYLGETWDAVLPQILVMAFLNRERGHYSVECLG
jgi:hypothetical protein